MRNPVRLLTLVVAIFCTGIALPVSAWEHWDGDRGGSRFSPLNQIAPAGGGAGGEGVNARTLCCHRPA
jgi:quinoprotein glucose dehydrogenase